jgi:cell division septation protein DedD
MTRMLLICLLIVFSGCALDSSTETVNANLESAAESEDATTDTENLGGAVEIVGQQLKPKLGIPATIQAPVMVDEAAFSAELPEIHAPDGVVIEHNPLVGKPTLAPLPMANPQDYFNATQAAQSVLVTAATPTPESKDEQKTEELAQDSLDR